MSFASSLANDPYLSLREKSLRVDVKQKSLVVLGLDLRDVVGQVLELEEAQFLVVTLTEFAH